jgi:integrase
MKTPPKAKGEAVEVVESKASKIPIYAGMHHGKESFLIAYYADGARKRERFPTIEDARKRAKEKIEELAKGTAHVGAFTPRQIVAVIDAVDLLKGIGVSLSQVAREYVEAFKILRRQPLIAEAAKHYAAHLERQTSMHAVKFPAVVDEFLKAIETKGRSARYVEDCTSRLSRAAKAFRGYLQRITSSELEAWLDSIKAAGRTRNNYRATLCTLLSFARSRGYLPRNERTEAEMTMKASDRGGEIGIYTPKELSVMLTGIEAKFLPLVALGAFAGLRTAEIHRIEWQDVDLRGGHVVVGKKAKTGQRRIVPILPALGAWIAPVAKHSGPVIPRYSGDAPLLRAFRQALEPLNVELVPNGFRHSFASYRLAAVQSADQVALEMGSSPRKLFQNYRELVTQAQAHKWFSVMPEESGKIVGIHAA